MGSLEFLEHQKEGLKFLSERRSAGLFFEMGLGKTLTLLQHLSTLDRYQALPALIVAPISFVGGWVEEIKKFEFNFSTKILLGTRTERIMVLDEAADIYIINYEGCNVIPHYLCKKKFKTIVLDESHRIKNRAAKQTQNIMLISKTCDYRYILSGTPFCKSPEDLWSQIYFLDKTVFPSFYAFRNRYIVFRKVSVRVKSGGMREVKVPYRFRHLEELEEKISHICLRKTKKECLDLPDKIYTRLYYNMSKDQVKHYEGVKYALSTMLKNNSRDINSASAQLQKMRQILSGFIYSDDKAFRLSSNGKLDLMLDLLKDICASNDSVIIFTVYCEDIEIVSEALKKTDFKVVVFGGKDRTAEVKEFNEHDGPAIFLANIEKAKEGLTLTKATHVIYYSQTYKYDTRMQSEDRAHRIGQSQSVNYYDMIAKNTIEEVIMNKISIKSDAARRTLGDPIELAKECI